MKKEKQKRCDGCGQFLIADLLYQVDTLFYCESCYNEGFFTCASCGKVGSISDNYEFDDEDYCNDCYNENFATCGGCGIVFRNEDTQYDGVNECYYCNDCFPEDNLNSYNFRPKYKFYKTQNEENHKLYFGIELEVENEGLQNTEDIVDNLPDYQYAKRDSSIDNGFEIVSHPATYNWLNNNAKIWDNLLVKLSQRGYRSYDTDTCGIHIHLSKTAFTGLHLYRFLKFFLENPGFIVAISQRSAYLLSRWASLELNKGESIVYKAKTKDTITNRYMAVNLIPEDTVEVRIFKGTLNKQSFWKNVQFVKALYDYTLNCNWRTVSLTNFLNFLSEHTDEYRQLQLFIEDKNLCV